MKRLGYFRWLFIIGLGTTTLAGCIIQRPNGAAGDIQESVPPVIPMAQQTAVATTAAPTMPAVESIPEPTLEPTASPTTEPTLEPTASPTIVPTEEPMMEPTTGPATEPSEEPAVEPTAETTMELAEEATTESVPAVTSKPYLPPGATIGFCYSVQRGETIYSLAHKFNTSPYAINLVNDLFPPDMVYANQTLFIPEKFGHGPNLYILEEDEPLADIAAKCRLPALLIARVNGLDPEALLLEGDAIVIPIPPFPPPARFKYPRGPLPIVPYPPNCCTAFPPYQPGPPPYN